LEGAVPTRGFLKMGHLLAIVKSHGKQTFPFCCPVKALTMTELIVIDCFIFHGLQPPELPEKVRIFHSQSGKNDGST